MSTPAPPPPSASPPPLDMAMPDPAGSSGSRGSGRGSGGRPLASPFAAVVGYTLRGCLPARRWWGVLLPCLGAVLFGFMTQVVDNADTSLDTYEAFGVVAQQGLFGLVLPLTCLVIGDAVMGADIRAGTFPLTWLSPVPFRTIALGRWLGGWIVALVTIVPALALAALLSGVPDAGEAAATMALAGVAGSAAYIGLFIMIGVLARRSAVWALAIVFLGERLLGNALSGIAQLSPMWESSQVYAGLGPGGDELVRDGTPQGWGAVVRLAIVLAVTLIVASRRLRRLTPTGGDE
jgi:hypothetical protein